MHSPKALYQDKLSTYTLNYNPVVFIKYINRNIANDSFKNNEAFKVTPKNLYRTIKFFNTIVSWFVDTEKIDLYLKDENDNLIFNADYNKLTAIIAQKGTETAGVMKAIPTVVEINNDKFEGINLYINNLTNVVQLTVDELATIFDILKTFSFYNEMLCDIAAYEYAVKHNNVETDITRWNSKTYSKMQSSSPVKWG
jgi:carbamoylphosphate synthase small subunit